MKWHVLELGGGQLTQIGDTTHLSIPGKNLGYANAQIDDTHPYPRDSFKWKPPVQLRLKARATPGQPLGTLGFGFWNDPFSLSLGMKGAARRLPVLPQALWFFYSSPPNDIRLSKASDGSGWKAMSIRSPGVPGTLLLLPAVLGAGLAQLRFCRRIIMSLAQRVVKAHEAQLHQALDDWHEYEITWEHSSARFCVDGDEILQASHPPGGPLGFVAWVDNQYAIASPHGGFRFGLIPTTHTQALEMQALQILNP